MLCLRQRQLIETTARQAHESGCSVGVSRPYMDGGAWKVALIVRCAAGSRVRPPVVLGRAERIEDAQRLTEEGAAELAVHQKRSDRKGNGKVWAVRR